MNMERKGMVLGEQENQQIAMPRVQVRDIVTNQLRVLKYFYKERCCSVIDLTKRPRLISQQHKLFFFISYRVCFASRKWSIT